MWNAGVAMTRFPTRRVGCPYAAHVAPGFPNFLERSLADSVQSRRNLLLRLEYSLALIGARKGSDSRCSGRRAPIAAIRVVTAESVRMAVILIVEDDAFIREIAEMMIQDWGHEHLSASDVDEALSLLRSPQHIDALFTDIYLKKAVLGGYELAHAGHQAPAEVACALHDRKFHHRQNETLFVEGAHFLQKPYTPTAAPKLR